MLKIIGLEEHMATPDVFAAWRRLDPDLTEPVVRWTVSGNVAAPLTDLGQGRLDAMDIAGVDTAVLSLTTPGLQTLPAPEAVALQGPTNDVIADAVNAHVRAQCGWRGLHSAGLLGHLRSINTIGHTVVVSDPGFRSALSSWLHPRSERRSRRAGAMYRAFKQTPGALQPQLSRDRERQQNTRGGRRATPRR